MPVAIIVGPLLLLWTVQVGRRLLMWRPWAAAARRSTVVEQNPRKSLEQKPRPDGKQDDGKRGTIVGAAGRRRKRGGSMWRHSRKQAWKLYTHSRSYKLVTLGLLLVYPTIARKCLSTFVCMKAVTAEGKLISLVREDPAVVCHEEKWLVLATAAAGGLLVYCLGLPLFALRLIKQSMRTALAVKASQVERMSRPKPQA